MRWTAPRSGPPASSLDAPAAMSGTPSRLMSPTGETEEPNRSPSASSGPLAVPLFISIVSLTPPAGVISMRWTAPRSGPPASSWGAPAAMSGTPSPSMSPAGETEEPNASPLASSGPLVVLPVIAIVRFTPPAGPISMRWTAPLSE